MAPQQPVPPPPLANYRPSFERAPLGSGPRRDKRPPPPPPRRGGGLLLGIVYLFLFVILVVAGGAGYLALHPPSNLIRQKVAEAVKARTGRDLVIAGQPSFVFFPEFGISLSNVSLSAPPGMDGKLVEMQALDINLRPWPLLSRQIEVNSVVLHKPIFDFRIDANGHNNWEFAEVDARARFAELQTPGTLRDVEPAQFAAAGDGDAPAEDAPSKPRSIQNLKLEDVRVEDGTFRFTDDRAGKTQQVSAVNVTLALASLESPLVAKGDLTWHDQRVDFEGKLSDVEEIMSRKLGHLSFKAKGPAISASYDGGIVVKDGVYLEGDVTAQSDSARALADWFGTTLPPVSGFGPLSLKGTLKTAGNVTVFSNAEFGLDGATAKGTIKVTTGGVRPYVEASLEATELDLNKYLTGAVTGVLATGSSAQLAAPALKPSSGDGTATSPDEIEKLLNTPASKVYGAIQRAGWSSEVLNLTLLGVTDGNARLNVGRLHFKNMLIGQSSVVVAVQNKAMKATFEDVQLYHGHGKGVLTIDGSGSGANIAANFNLDGISALPFLKDATNFEWVAGNSNVAFQLVANGASQLQLVESLSGKASFKFSDGAIVGFNLPGAIRGVSHGDFSGLKKAPSEKTDFSELGATFDISNGVAQNSDLLLVSPLLRVSGAGTVHMPERTVDYTVKPKLVASLEGQQGETTDGGIEIPVHITGSWDKPKYQPDLKGLLSDPNKTVDAIKEIGKKMKGKNANQIVDQLFGKQEGDASQDPNASTKASAKALLNKFLGKEQDGN